MAGDRACWCSREPVSQVVGGNSASTFGPPTRVAPRSRPRLRGFHPSIHTRAARLRRPIPAASSIVTHPKSPRRGGPAHPTPPRWRGRRRLSRSRVKEKALQKECGPGARQEASCSRPCTPRPDTCARPRSSDVTSTGHWARQAPQDVVVGGVAWACLRLVLVAWCWLLASGTRLVRSRWRPRRRWVGTRDAACMSSRHCARHRRRRRHQSRCHYRDRGTHDDRL